MNCRGCGGALTEVLDLGRHRLPDFTDPGSPPPQAYPLRLMHCAACTLVQLGETTPRGILYTDRYGFKSGVNEAVRADLASVVKYAAQHRPETPDCWLDIACNDGTLLSFVPPEWRRHGIDPLWQFADEAFRHGDIVTDFFDPKYFAQRQFGVITSVSMFYDLDDPCAFARDVERVLFDDGIWVIQQNYALDMITRNAVDNICHEHVTYFTVQALAHVLAGAGLEINDVTYSDVNGGCVRTLVSRKGTRPVLPSAEQAVRREREAGLGRAQRWIQWGRAVTAELELTRMFLEEQKAAGRRVFLYGASTRGGTFLQMIGAGPELLPFAVERNPAKVGKVMAATGIPVISEQDMRLSPPEFLLVSPWFFRDVFLMREQPYLAAGGRMVFPLPKFEIIGGVRG